MNRKKAGLLLLVSAAVLCGVTLLGLLFSRNLSKNESTSKFPVSIREYMSSNTLYPDENGVACDWVELYNAASSEISISGFKLTDTEKKARYSIPHGTVIEPGGTYVIYCLRDGGERYADFGISKDGGETLLLLNKKNVLIESVETIALPENCSALRGEDGTFAVCETPTPGDRVVDRTGDAAQDNAGFRVVRGDVSISELCGSNTLYPVFRGEALDFAELFNSSDKDLDLGGYRISLGGAEQTVLEKGTVIPAKGYLVIPCCPGKTGTAQFRLSREGGDDVLLYDAKGVLIDRMVTLSTVRGGSTVRSGESAAVSACATPGYENSLAGHLMTLSAYSAENGVIIQSLMTDNRTLADGNGRITDRAELYNSGSEAADLGGYGLSDSPGEVKYVFPAGTVLGPGESLTVALGGSAAAEGEAPFALRSAGGETVYLTAPSGLIADACVTVKSGADCVLTRDGSGTRVSGVASAQTGPVGPRTLSISEIMTSNGCTIALEDGSFPDWVELLNTGSETVSLGDFYLSNDSADPFRFRLPETALKSGERIAVFCSSTDESGRCAPFNLSSNGGTLLLSDRSGARVDEATFGICAKDSSLVREANGELTETRYPTPGYDNTAEGYTAFLQSRTTPGVYIGEAMPSNHTVLRLKGEYYDFLEICNGTGGTVSLEGYTLTEDPDRPDMVALPSVTLKAGESLILYCSGNASLTDKEHFHLPFTLSSSGQRLYLYDEKGALADYLYVFDVPPEGSMGRLPGQNGIYAFDTPSPGRNNTGGQVATARSQMPAADKPSGVYEQTGGFFVSLTAEGEIRYTLDGSRPDRNSPLYEGPVSIERTSVLRCTSFEEGKRESLPLTLAYTVNEGHSLGVVHVALNPEDYIGEKGIFSNPKEYWERPGTMVYTDAAGNTYSHDCGVRLSGQHSRSREQKSYKLVFSGEYGGRLDVPLYGEDYDQTSFPCVLLRAGVDSKYGIIREPLIQQLALPSVKTTSVQNSVPVIVYVNGEYRGIYFLMEAYTEETIADRYGIPTESVTLFKGYMYPGNRYEIYQLFLYVQSHSMKNEADYAYIKSKVDFDSLIDWAIFQAYCRNADVSGNVRYFKSDALDGKWHFIFYDAECGFKSKVKASFNIALSSGQTADFLIALLQNGEFRDMFFTRLAYHYGETFRKERVLEVFDGLFEAVQPEAERQFLYYGLKPITFTYNTNQIRTQLNEDRAGDLVKSARDLMNMTDAEYETYFGGIN